MPDSNNVDGKPKRPKAKLVPIVDPRRRRSVKKEAVVKTPSEEKTAAFQELVEAAHKDADWERGTGRPKPRATTAQSAVIFGGCVTSSRHRESKKVVWSSTAQGECKSEIQKEDKQPDPIHGIPHHHIHHPNHPTTLPIQLNQDADDCDDDVQKLLPRYVEEKLTMIDSDSEDTTAAEEVTESIAADSSAMLFQLPAVVPVAEHKHEDSNLTTAGDIRNLPEGRIGKLLIYKSGKVRMRIGDVLLDVSTATPWPFSQQLVAINVREDDGHCVFLGNVRKRALCTLNVNQLMDCEIDDPIGQPEKQKRKLESSTGLNESDVQIQTSDSMFVNEMAESMTEEKAKTQFNSSSIKSCNLEESKALVDICKPPATWDS